MQLIEKENTDMIVLYLRQVIKICLINTSEGKLGQHPFSIKTISFLNQEAKHGNIKV